MDITDGIADTTTLSYDDTVPYEDLPPPETALASRIGNTKLYLLSETSKSRSGKSPIPYSTVVSANTGKTNQTEKQRKTSTWLKYRENALLLHGSPISHLPTSNIFAYATHFDAYPMGLEWVDDSTCILVFDSKAMARTALRHLTKSPTEEPSVDDGSVTAKPIPVTLWPPEERIHASLGKGEGLKGTMRMRWATAQDVKQRGAKKASEFYKKYGKGAEAGGDNDARSTKRRRGEGGVPVDEAAERARLDRDLDAFLAEDDEEPIDDAPPSPPSKMRSDYMGKTGKSLLERTSMLRAHPDLEPRTTAELPRRARADRPVREWDEGRDFGSRHTDHRRNGRERTRGERGAGRRPPREQKTAEDLDAELDAFLNSKD